MYLEIYIDGSGVRAVLTGDGGALVAQASTPLEAAGLARFRRTTAAIWAA